MQLSYDFGDQGPTRMQQCGKHAKKNSQVAATDTRGAPKASPKCPTRVNKEPHRSPQVPKETPKSPKEVPNGAQDFHNGAQGTQKRFKQKRTWKTQYYRRKSLPGGENVNKHMEKPHLRNSRFCVFSLQPTKTRRILRVRGSAVPPARGFEGPAGRVTKLSLIHI